MADMGCCSSSGEGLRCRRLISIGGEDLTTEPLRRALLARQKAKADQPRIFGRESTFGELSSWIWACTDPAPGARLRVRGAWITPPLEPCRTEPSRWRPQLTARSRQTARPFELHPSRRRIAAAPSHGVHAGTAPIDCAYCQRSQLEIGSVHARISMPIHAQPSWHCLVFGIGGEMYKSVVDVVHRHDGCCGFRRLDRCRRHHHACGGFHSGVTIGLRAAIAFDSNRPYLLCGDNVSSAIIDARLSLTSLAKSGIWSFMVDRHVPSSNFQCLAADLAVAGAELVGL